MINTITVVNAVPVKENIIRFEVKTSASPVTFKIAIDITHHMKNDYIDVNTIQQELTKALESMQLIEQIARIFIEQSITWEVELIPKNENNTTTPE